MHFPKILIIEDEDKIRSVLRAYLIREGYEITEANSGDKGLQLFNDYEYDLVLLDLMLPGIPGEKIAAKIREKKETPVIMLTAKGEEWERLQGFTLGADDYIVKPFSPREVVARIKAVLKRTGKNLPSDQKPVNIDGFTIDPGSRSVNINDKPVNLTATEFDLLFELATHPGRVFKRGQLTAIVSGYTYDGYERTIDSHIKNIRKKIGNNCIKLETVYGIGYKLTILETGK